MTRDASGPGFRSVEPHRFRSAAQPTDLPGRRRRISWIRVREALSKSVPASRHRETHRRHTRSIPGIIESSDFRCCCRATAPRLRRSLSIEDRTSNVRARNEVTRDFRANLRAPDDLAAAKLIG